MEIGNRYNQVFFGLITIINIVTIAILGWSCYRGFDLSDESFYFLGYLYVDHSPPLLSSSFHLVFSKFFSAFDFTLPEVRLLRLSLTGLASGVLFLGLNKLNIAGSKLERAILFNVVLSGMLLSYAWAPLALSYNSMSTVLFSMIIGCWLLLMTRKTVYMIFTYSAIIGFLLGILFFVKVTNMLLIPLILIATIVWFFKFKLLNLNYKKFFLISAPSLGIGIFFSLLLISNNFFDIQTTVSDYIEVLFGTLKVDDSHSIGALLKRYYDNFYAVIQRIMYPTLIILALFIATEVYRKFSKQINLKWAITAFKLTSVILLIAIIFLRKYWQGGIIATYQILDSYVIVFLITYLNMLLERREVKFLLILGLIGIPFCGAAGTNNGLSAQFLFYGTFIFLLIYYTLKSSEPNWFRQSIMLLLVTLVGFQTATATVFYPYKQVPLTQSTYKVTRIHELEGLKLDKTTFELSQELSFLGELSQKYMFTPSKFGGLILLANKTPYSLSWISKETRMMNCQIFTRSEMLPKDVIFVLPTSYAFDEKSKNCMIENGIDLENGFELIKQFSFFSEEEKKDVELSVYVYSTTQ
jgi:hypothetical protein